MKKRTTVFVLLITLLFSFCSCTEETIDSVCSSERAYSSYSSAIIDDSRKDDYPSFSKETVDESLDISAFSLTTDKTEYDYKEAIKLTLTVESEYSFYFGEDHFVEYYDGEWKKCEIGYDVIEIIHEAKKEADIKFPLSERADKGKEKYRVGLDVRMSYDTKTVFTVYSNEFFIKAE